MSTLLDALAAHARHRPQHVAYRFLESDAAHPLTYAALDEWSDGLAATLKEIPEHAGPALLLLPAGHEFLAAFLGCLKAGTLAVPVALPRHPRQVQTLAAIAASARPTLAISTRAIMAQCEGWFETDPILSEMAWLDIADIPRGGMPHAARPQTWVAEGPAYLQYTSGSTTTPKGVIVSHANLAGNIEDIISAFKLNADSVIGSWLPHFHDMGLVGGLLTPLYLGATCNFMAPMSFLTRPRTWLEAIDRWGIEVSGGPNFAYDLCRTRIQGDALQGLDLSRWRLAFSGAEPVSARSLQDFIETFAPCGFRAEALFPCYGLAEATLYVSGRFAGAAGALHVDAQALSTNRVVLAPESKTTRTLVSCGRWSSSTSVRIVDESGIPTDDGQVGEIWVAGPGVSHGYHGNEEASTCQFGGRLPEDDRRYLRTGDLGFIHEGELFVCGRLKDVIIVGGRNFHAWDLEKVAREQSPELHNAAIVAFGIAPADGPEEIHMLIERPRQLSEDHRAVVKRILAAVSEQFDVAIQRVTLTRHGALPRTTSGKLKRAACRAGYLDGSLQALTDAELSRRDKRTAEAVSQEGTPL